MMIYLLHSIGVFAQHIVQLIATVILYPFSFLFGKLLEAAENHGIINETISEFVMLFIFISVIALFLFGGYLLFKYSLFLLIAAYFSSVLFGLTVILLGFIVCYYLLISKRDQLRLLIQKLKRHKKSVFN